MTSIQAILFDVDKYSVSKANAWLKKHDYVPIKEIHTTKKYHRARIKEPRKDMQKRIISFGKGIKAIIQYK